MLLDKNTELNNRLQDWKTRINDDAIALKESNKTIVDREIVINNDKSTEYLRRIIKDSKINTFTQPLKPTQQYLFSNVVSGISSQIRYLSETAVRKILNGEDMFKTIPGLETVVVIDGDFATNTVFIKKIMAGRRTKAKNNNKEHINKFILDYEDRTYYVQADTDKRFTKERLEIFKNAMEPIIALVNNRGVLDEPPPPRENIFQRGAKINDKYSKSILTVVNKITEGNQENDL